MLQKCLKLSHVIGRKLLTHASRSPITAERECNMLCALVAMALSPIICIVLNVCIIKSAICTQKTFCCDTVISIKLNLE